MFKEILKIIRDWWLDRIRVSNEIECFRCGKSLKRSEAERFVLCEDAFGKTVEWYHPICKEKMILNSLAHGVSPVLRHISVFGKIPEDVQKRASEKLEKLEEDENS